MRRRWLFTLVPLALIGGGASWLFGHPFEAYEPRAGSESTSGVRGEEAPLGAAPNPVDEVGSEPVDAGADAAALPPLPAAPAERAHRHRTPQLVDTDNYLLVGVDKTHGPWGRADTLLVAVFDPESGHAGVVSVPRDLYVTVPGHGDARINATLRIAARLGEDPPELLRRVVSDTLAMPIQHVVIGDLTVFERAVDALGGVDLEVPCPIVDDFIDERTKDGRRVLDLAAGLQHLDGVTAAMYARSRHGRSDWDRARRQQAILFAMKRRLRELGPRAVLPFLSDELFEDVHSDMNRLELFALLRRVSRLRRDRLHGVVLGHREMTAYRTPEGRAVQVPELPAIDQALRHLFDAPLPGTRGRHARCRDADAALRSHRD